MHVFKHAQPALLYIVPLCLIVPLTIALIQGDIKRMFIYRDHDEKDEASKPANAADTSTASSEGTPSGTPSKDNKKSN
jgi:minor histocompatibility antigen H13